MIFEKKKRFYLFSLHSPENNQCRYCRFKDVNLEDGYLQVI